MVFNKDGIEQLAMAVNRTYREKGDKRKNFLKNKEKKKNKTWATLG